MPLETLGEKGALNIKRLEITEPAPASLRDIFDFEREVTPEIKKKIIDRVRHGSDDGLTRFLQLFPNEAGAVADVLPPEAALREILQDIFEQAPATSPERFLRVAHQRAVMYPGVKQEFLKDQAWSWVRDGLHARRDSRMWEPILTFGSMMAEARVVFPEHSEELLLGEQDFQKLRVWVEDTCGKHSIFEHAQVAASMRLFFPLKCTNEWIRGLEWPRMVNMLSILRKDEVSNTYIEVLFYVRVLTAQSVEITAHGLEFSDAVSDFTKEIPPLPEIKK